MKNRHLALIDRIRSAEPHDPIPSETELVAHLAARRELVCDTALAEFAYLQAVAAERWDAAATSRFGRVLRQARARAATPRGSEWDVATRQAGFLPEDWRAPMLRQIDLSRAGLQLPHVTLWSFSYTTSVLAALLRWLAHCAMTGVSRLATGLDLDRYAEGLVCDTDSQVSIRTAADYVARIAAGLALVEPTALSSGRDFVVRDWRERADRSPRHTKTGAQIVGAAAIYALGFEHMAAARAADMRGVRAATRFRDGLILALGAALPQRARALSALAFGSTLSLDAPGRIHVRIPATFQKMPEAEKASAPHFKKTFRNAGLAAALEEYRQDFRPIFDDGNALFPSVKSRGEAITRQQIGRLTGDLTLAAFGTRIPIHRVRDNVATEASEELSGGRLAASGLLDHRDVDVTGRHYDHSDAFKAGTEFDGYIDGRRQNPVDLAV